MEVGKVTGGENEGQEVPGGIGKKGIEYGLNSELAGMEGNKKWKEEINEDR